MHLDADEAEPLQPVGLLRGNSPGGGFELEGDGSKTADREGIRPATALLP